MTAGLINKLCIARNILGIISEEHATIAMNKAEIETLIAILEEYQNGETKVTAEEFIAQLKAECEHNIKKLEKRAERILERYYHGYTDGQLRWDKVMLEKIEEWEKQK